MSEDSKPYQICVLGSGPAGQTIAVKMARRGYRVVVLEKREWGGTCALRGCNPKKVLSNGASLIDAFNGVRGKMTTAEPALLNWPTLHAFQTEFTDPVPDSTREKFDELGIDHFIGSAHFTGPGKLRINDRPIEADRIVIATGCKPAVLSFPGAEWVTTSDQFLDLQQLPERILFVGGGYISMEFAHVTVRCGSQVTVVQRGERILKQFDSDLVRLLSKFSIESGIQLITNHDVVSVQKNSEGSLVATLREVDDDDDAKTQTIEIDLIVHGAGRTANFDGLGLDAIGLKASDKGLPVDSFGRCLGSDHVYAVGDCADSGFPPLTPTAQYEAETVVKNLQVDFGEDGDQTEFDPGPVTAVAFTPVPIASVGLTHDQAEKQVKHLQVNHENTSTWGSVRKTGQTCSGFKILIDKDSRKIVGAHLLGPRADEQINLFTLAIRFGLTAENLKTTLFGYPTLSADIHRML